jgi:hypothetical protein
VLLDPPAPPFTVIANRADLTRAWLRHFIVTTHWDEKTLPLTVPNPQCSIAKSPAKIREHTDAVSK